MAKKNIVLISGTQVESTIRHLGGLIKNTHLDEEYDVFYLCLGTKTNELPGKYPEDLKKDIINFLMEKKPLLIGVSIIDYEEKRILDLMNDIKNIKEFSPKIVAGGAQVIEFPERYLNQECIDMICYSRGWNFPEIIKGVDKGNLDEVNGIWISGMEKNPVPDLNVTIRGQPLPDYSLENTYRIYSGRLVNAANAGIRPIEHHQYTHKNTAVVVVSEGCINNCEYCNIHHQNLKFKKYCGARNYIKYDWREPKEAISVIKEFMSHNPNTEYVMFNDNDLAMISIDDTRKLMKLYRDEIGLPFYCQCSPNTITKDHIIEYANAGLDALEIGVQGSQKSNISAGYKRVLPDKMIFDFVRNVAPYLEQRDSNGNIVKDGVKIGMDFINGNALHEKDDLISTIRFIQQITDVVEEETLKKGSWNVVMHNLTLDEERELAKKNAEKFNEISVGEAGESDYHSVEAEDFFKFNEFYLNIVLELLSGVHDQVLVGKLPRKSSEFFDLVSKMNDVTSDMIKLLNEKSQEYEETINLLLDQKIYKFFNSEKGKEPIKKIYEFIQRNKNTLVEFSFQYANRYDYDWEWARDQIQ